MTLVYLSILSLLACLLAIESFWGFPQSNPEEIFLLEFYTPWCTHCQEHAKDVKNVALRLVSRHFGEAAACLRLLALCMRLTAQLAATPPPHDAGGHCEVCGDQLRELQAALPAFESEVLPNPQPFPVEGESGLRTCIHPSLRPTTCTACSSTAMRTPLEQTRSHYDLGLARARSWFAQK